MTTPPGSRRAELARRWANALRTTTYVPTSRNEIESLLRELLDSLFDALTVEEFSPDPGRVVGQRLVAGHFTGEQSLSRTVEVLGQGLPVSPELRGVDGLANKVTSLLGALAGGYASALRAHTLDQQEKVSQALLKAREDAERGLRVSEATFRQLFTSSAAGIAISGLDGELLETNQALRKIVGDLATRHSLYELFHPADVAPLRTAYQRLVDGNSTSSRLPQQIRLIDKDGEPAWTYLAASLLCDADGKPTHQVTIVEDVTDAHLLGQQLRHQSLHDALTGLPNQQFFMSTLEGVLGRADPASRITVCKIDLDRLAVINDGFGREVGDQVLRSVAERLQSAVAGDQATVARFGSDEFAILIENSLTTPGVAALAAHINAELAAPVYVDGYRLAVSGCVGVVEHQGRGMAAATLLGAAETALHGVKSTGVKNTGVKNTGHRQWGLFDPHRDADHRIQCRLAAAMPGAWENGEISLDYQPLARLSDGMVVGIAPLLRWEQPQGGPLSHRECLELAARTGWVIPLGQWMLRSACEQLASWRQHLGAAAPRLHVDLTPQQSHDPDLVADVLSTLEQAGLAAECLQLGIPVSALDAPGDSEGNLRVLADAGVGITLREFDGVADATYLEDLPARTVEIAPRVVQRVVQQRVMQRPGDDSAVAHAVPVLLQLVHRCGATVIVRDIGNRHEADWWKSAGADVGQGAFLALPDGPDEIVALLGSRRASPRLRIVD